MAQYSIDQLSPIINNSVVLQQGNNIPRAAIATITLAIPVLSKAVAPVVEKKKSGMFSGGNIGLTISTRKSRYEMNDKGMARSGIFSEAGNKADAKAEFPLLWFFQQISFLRTNTSYAGNAARHRRRWIR
ncbi:hypothetical protein [Rahnella victoriana]|uniref:Uncharacterized protein n=1 Tax=Rahnella victoriana TaxID=1510570 RepID=A0ABS0DXE2_9GAMM|nr:hypothetical protein [Rahnella victoriana]MBF7958564.1 hypothetical protein [Rahnella victoriana]TBX31829.1 hypothetical protein EYY67_20915 [Rahnella victoriana]